MKKKALYVLATSIVLVMPFFLGSIADAATEVLSLSPTSIKPVIKPGASMSGNFEVLNQGQESYPIHIYAAPYSVKSEAYIPDFSPIPGTPAVSSWLHFSVTKGTIRPNHSLTVHYSLSVPKGVQPGGYYAVAFAETQPQKTKQGVVVNEQVGEIFYIQVAGPVKKAGKLLSWSSPFLQKSPLTANLRLENSGGLQYFSNVQMVVSDLFGTPKYTLTTQKVVLPQTIRDIPDSWTNAPAFGLFKVNGSATVLGKEKTLPTKYVLVMSQTVRKVCLIILILLVLLVLARLLIRKKTNGRSKR